MDSVVDPLNLDTVWSVGERAFAEIEARFKEAKPQSIVEFGSGASTVRLAKAFPAASLLSIDHDAVFHSKTRELLATHGIDPAKVRVDLRRIRWACYGSGLHQTYAAGDLPDKIDAVLIDGPPARFCRGREACLYQVISRLRVGGIVILDDYGRPGEAAGAANWRSVYGDSIYCESVQVHHGLFVVRKLRKRNPMWFSPRLLPPALWSYCFLAYEPVRCLRDRRRIAKNESESAGAPARDS